MKKIFILFLLGYYAPAFSQTCLYSDPATPFLPVKEKLSQLEARYHFPVPSIPGENEARPSILSKRIIAATTDLDSVRYYYSGTHGSNFVNSLYNMETWHAPLYTPYQTDKWIAYDSAAKWHRHYQEPDTSLRKRRTFVNNYNGSGFVSYIHNPSNTKNEMVNAPYSRGEKYTDIVCNAYGLPVSFRYYIDTSWKYSVTDYYFGDEQYQLKGSHLISYNNDLPVHDIYKANKNDTLINHSRISYYYNVMNVYDSILVAKWDTVWISDTTFLMDWVDTARSIYNQGDNGSYVVETFYRHDPLSWVRNNKLKVDYDLLHRLVNQESYIFRETENVYYTENKFTQTFTGNQMQPSADSSFLGFSIYVNSGGGFNGSLFTDSSVWVPYSVDVYYNNNAGAIDSFIKSRNFDTDNSMSLQGWLPVTKGVTALNTDNLVTKLDLFFNSQQNITWRPAYTYKYYYENYDIPSGMPQAAETKKDLILFPNPAMQSVTVKWDPRQIPIAYIDITDAAGKKVLHLNTKNEPFIIQLTTLSSGIYYCSFLDEDGIPVTSSRLLQKQ